MSLHLVFILQVAALVCFIAATAQVPVRRINVLGLGLTLWLLSLLVTVR